MHRALAPSLALLLSTGCYASHMRGETSDAGPVRTDARATSATDAARPDASVMAPSCTSLTASRGVLLTHPSPNDFSLGSAHVTGPNTAMISFTSSNAVVEMDISRWVLPLDLDTGVPLVPERITVFGEPVGSSFAAHARLVVGPRSIFAFTWSEGQGCLRRRLDARGAFLGPELRDDDGACLSARVMPLGEIVYFRREGIARGAGYFETVNDEGAQISVTGIGPAALELRSLTFSWAIDPNGEIVILATDAMGTRFARWPELAWRNVEGAGAANAMRLVAIGDRLLGAWISTTGEIEMAYSDDALLHRTGITAVRASSIDMMPRADEIWVAYDAGASHADARATIARLDLNLVERAPRTEVGLESFVGPMRLLPSPRGALLIEQGQRADAEGGHNIFAIPVGCADVPERPTGCASWQVSIDRCVPQCDIVPSYVWDGARCAPEQCNCVGEDCRFAYADENECLRDHAMCASTRCESTGGVWLAPNHQYCSAPTCGMDTGECDDFPVALCHCGLNALYDARMGCVTGFCGGTPSTDQLRCERSGGSWGTNCNHSHCGQSPDPCVDLACRCADNQVWNEVAGCVVSAECDLCAGG